MTKKTQGFRSQGQMYGLTVREIGGGLPRHHRAPSIRGANYHIVKPSVLVNRIQMIKTLRGHRNAVYCGNFLSSIVSPKESKSLKCMHRCYHSINNVLGQERTKCVL